jgi:hypothetical protein
MLAILMGLSLGLVGAGGSILTVPILVYLLKVKPVIATAYSLFIVGCTSVAGAFSYWRAGNVFVKEGVLFAIPAMSAVFFTRSLILPLIPELVMGLPKDAFIMLLFSSLMIIAALFMFTNKLQHNESNSTQYTVSTVIKIIIGSLCVGFLTGMVGAGGGFLIIPSLMGLFGFSIKNAVGTSLFVIAINSFVGVNGDFIAGVSIDWKLVLFFVGLTLIGALIGTTIGKHTEAKRVKSLFAIFTLLMGLLILSHELFII